MTRAVCEDVPQVVAEVCDLGAICGLKEAAYNVNRVRFHLPIA